MNTDILKNLNRRLDHAALKSNVTETTIRTACREAVEHRLYALAVNPAWVPVARDELAASDTRILSVAGFPLGASRPDIKADEAARGVRDGAREIDMVANIGWLRDRDRLTDVEKEIKLVRQAIPYNVILKVIIECPMLTVEQMHDATLAVINGGAQFVKTATGFFGGATVDQVRTLHRAAAGQIEVKASGGITTLDHCRNLLDAGATRLGTSSSVAIMNELNA